MSATLLAAKSQEPIGSISLVTLTIISVVSVLPIPKAIVSEIAF